MCIVFAFVVVAVVAIVYSPLIDIAREFNHVNMLLKFNKIIDYAKLAFMFIVFNSSIYILLLTNFY